MKFKCLLEDRVLVLPDEPEKMTKGGIILPDGVKERPRRGKVVAVGPGKKRETARDLPPVFYYEAGNPQSQVELMEACRASIKESAGRAFVAPSRRDGQPSIQFTSCDRHPMTVQVGDDVLFTIYSGASVEMNGVDYRIMTEAEIIGVLEPNTKVTLDEHEGIKRDKAKPTLKDSY